MDWGLYILVSAILLDMVIGDPDIVWRRIPHPVVFFGFLINGADNLFNIASRGENVRKLYGSLSILVLLGFALGLGYLIQALLQPLGSIGFIIEALIISIFIAQKSLSDHVRRIIKPLESADIEGARYAVSMIVGRETKELNEADISRATIESLSENYSDGVTAPIFWCLLLGLPGILAYKMLNTADSMIGHKNDKYESFGWAAARLDDLANWLPARISWLLIIGSTFFILGFSRSKKSILVALADAKFHRSPNAGWPEGAMAGALDVVLSGPRSYGNNLVEEAYLNENGRSDLVSNDIANALKVYWGACFLGLFLVVMFAVFNHII